VKAMGGPLPAGAGVARSRRRARGRGFSLVEILLVVALMALLGGLVIGGSGLLASSKLRAGTTMVLGAIRMATAHANATGEAARLVFDLEQGRLALEETRDRMVIASPHDREAGAEAGAKAATDFEKRASEYAHDLFSGPKAPQADFKPVATLQGEDGKPGRELGSGVRIARVQTEHDLEPRFEGRAYLYFWPGGGTEQAVIELVQGEEPEGLSVIVSALTGRARVQRGHVDLEMVRQDGVLGEREAD
jgi:general secretion pathway protein H